MAQGFDVQAALASGATQAQIDAYLHAHPALSVGQKPQDTSSVPLSPVQSVTPAPSQPQNLEAQAGNFLTENLPAIGQVAGATLGGLAGGPVGSILGGGVGGSAGEIGKEALKKEKLNSGEILKQGAIGAGTGLVGEALGPAVEVAGKLPGIGPVIEGISNFGDTQLSKIFGVGDIGAKEGTMQLVKRAKDEGLVLGKSSLKDIGASAVTKLGEAGADLGKALETADKSGGGVAAKDILQMVEDSIPKVGIDKKGLDTLLNTAKKRVVDISQTNAMNEAVAKYGDKIPRKIMEDILQQVQSGEAKIPLQELNSLKQEFADLAKFGSEKAGPVEQFARSFASGLKQSIEDGASEAGQSGIKELNQRWWDLKQIVNNVQTAADRTGTATRAGISKAGLLRAPSVQLGIGQAAQFGPATTGRAAIGALLPSLGGTTEDKSAQLSPETASTKTPTAMDTGGGYITGHTPQEWLYAEQNAVAKGQKSLVAYAKDQYSKEIANQSKLYQAWKTENKTPTATQYINQQGGSFLNKLMPIPTAAPPISL